MIICSCFVVNDKQIREAAESGKPFKSLSHECGMGTNCGTCMLGAKEIYDAAKRQSRNSDTGGDESCARKDRSRTCNSTRMTGSV
jgi:bacterioferritin-associated ferredoxin